MSARCPTLRIMLMTTCFTIGLSESCLGLCILLSFRIGPVPFASASSSFCSHSSLFRALRAPKVHPDPLLPAARVPVPRDFCFKPSLANIETRVEILLYFLFYPRPCSLHQSLMSCLMGLIGSLRHPNSCIRDLAAGQSI